MSALGHYLEEEGVPTTQISLIREHTEALNPPRALWVPFMLGRPFGVPGDAAFQRRVLLAALSLLERDAGPVLEDFPEDAPHQALGPEPDGPACPVSFPRKQSSGTLAERLVDEAEQLKAWHEVARARRGHTTLGVTGLSTDALLAYVISWLEGQPKPVFRADLLPADGIKLVCDELKTFYYEALSAQPGRHDAGEFQDWFWMHTAAGEALLAIRDRARDSADPSLGRLANLSLVPRAVDLALKAGQGKAG